MKLRFTKMHGQGNDFVMINAVSRPLPPGGLTPERIRRLSDRHFGVGCDQVLVVEPSNRADVDFRYRIYNADGGEVEQCGNGSRCFARFVLDEGLTTKTEIRVETVSGIIAPRLEDSGEVTVNMGAPRFTPADVPFEAPARQREYSLEVTAGTRTIGVLSMGNPHAVQVVADVAVAPVHEEGREIEHHPRFPRRINAGFMQIVDRHHIRLRVWERGAGETLACGTGSCAAVVTGISWGLLDSPVRVTTLGGDLSIAWAGEGEPVLMTGAATTVYQGEIDLD
jgi:diaminopimelate epimerase